MIPLAVILAQLADLTTFAVVISLGVPGRELNPLMASLLASLGLAGVLAAKLVGAVAIGVGAMALRRRRGVLVLLLAVGLVGTLANVIALGGVL